MKIYVDTNVYLDYLLQRKNRSGKDLSDVASSIFFQAAKCRFEIIVSDIILQELRRYIQPEKTTLLFEMLHHKMLFTNESAEDRKHALNFLSNDAHHIAIASRMNAIVCNSERL